MQTRLQAQSSVNGKQYVASGSLLEKWNFAGTCGPECVRISEPSLPQSACGPACEPVSYRGTVHALRSISQREGIRALWRGTDIALLMSIPMVGVYLPLYDYLVEKMRMNNIGSYSPLLAGTLARTAAVYATAPFELMRTRVQAFKARPTTAKPLGYQLNPKKRGKGSFFCNLPTINQVPSKAFAAKTLWTGVGATLARDVPFSAMYWALAEPIRSEILRSNDKNSEREILLANVAAGGIAGSLSGALTTPLDVVKTRTQLAYGSQSSESVFGTLKNILTEEGIGGLYRGWSARAGKAAPACAIVLSAYEMLKYWHPGSE